MAKKTYDIGGTKVRAESASAAQALAAEINASNGAGSAANVAKQKQDAASASATSITGTKAPGSSIVSSSDTVVADERNISAMVAGLSVPDAGYKEAKKASDDYMKMLDEYYNSITTRGANDISGINAAFDSTISDTKQEQVKERGTTSVALARSGGYLGTTISGVGVLNTQAQQHRAEIAGLEVKRQAAIQEAKNAIAEKQFGVAKAKAEESKSLASEINKRRQDFFANSLNLLQESRAQEKQGFDRADRVAVTIASTIEGMDEAQAREYIVSAAKDIGIDANILMGSVNQIAQDAAEKIRSSVLSLSSKYPSANISPNDDWMTAQAKVRGSREYRTDIAKAEADLANSRSSARDNQIDYSDPRLLMYANATGKIVSSPSEARAVMGYSDSLLSGKEIVANDTPVPALTANKIREEDAKKMLTDAFKQFNKNAGEGISEATAWQWLASEEAQGMDDNAKGKELMSNGLNPMDFGIYVLL